MRDSIVFVIGLTIAACALIAGSTYFKTQELEAMRTNIESAIAKGIDPVAVRCAYADNRADTTCVAYAVTRGK